MLGDLPNYCTSRLDAEQTAMQNSNASDHAKITEYSKCLNPLFPPTQKSKLMPHNYKGLSVERNIAETFILEKAGIMFATGVKT